MRDDEAEQRQAHQRTDQRILRWFTAVHLTLCLFHGLACFGLAIIELATAARPCHYVRTWTALYLAFVPLYLLVQIASSVADRQHSQAWATTRYLLSATNGLAYVLQIIGYFVLIFAVLASADRFANRARGILPCQSTNPPLYYAAVTVAVVSAFFLVTIAATACGFFGLILARSIASANHHQVLRRAESLRFAAAGVPDPNATESRYGISRAFIDAHLPARTLPPAPPAGLRRTGAHSAASSSSSVDIASDRMCAICLSSLTTRAELDDEREHEPAAVALASSMRELPCGHGFHAVCIDPWLARARLCPLCKANIPNGIEAQLAHEPEAEATDAALTSASASASSSSSLSGAPGPSNAV
ncbi:uncharacterized protein AMSG_00223 [Thecamonas trahens ATCC 50062]|uniref:RING-type domain-containing protein n=1 Tax=Thecamonas trahens ATCC 50062 TaxID=461836 RepID=A0A0L0D1M7_THETB|nr:hypothetical protein AMSG_00223 [Thecamonas trahens ATCC 50062]KNC46106.1 hypothetical protein AMSG_00223 [Thecamonas trahens ATCC 50062]|eukprot:XP_013763084.1 hypothetical protein AMSG_00223 [Thecamonas trahens ATCC 50062]